MSDLHTAADTAAATANDAIAAADKAVDTLAANNNPTAADIQSAQDAIDAADKAIQTANEAKDAYIKAATDAGEAIEDTTAVGSTDAIQDIVNNTSIDITPNANNDSLSSANEVLIHSGGYDDANFRNESRGVTINGDHIGGNHRGITLTVLDDNNDLVSTKTFDTYGDASASNKLVDAIDSIQNVDDGSRVIITTSDEWTHQLSDDAKDALVSIGADRSTLDSADFRSSFLLDSQKDGDHWSVESQEYAPRYDADGITYNQDNTLSVDEDSSVTIDVLANDTDADGDTLSISKIEGQDVSNGQVATISDNDGNILGSASLTDDGKVEFTPSEHLQEMNAGENQDVTFSYTASDGRGGESTADVTVNVIADVAPNANNDSLSSANEVLIHSGGYDDANFRNESRGVTINGDHIGGNHRGITLTVLDDNNDLVSTKTFDTYGDASASNKLVDAIDSIQNVDDGSRVIITTSDEWTHQLSDDAKDALVSIGADRSTLDSADFRSSFLLDSQKDGDHWSVESQEYAPRYDADGITYNQDNTLSVDEDSSVTIDVLANDTDADGDTLSISKIEGQDVSNGQVATISDNDGNILGSASLTDDGKVEFTPSEHLQEMNAGENQDVTFSYTASDGRGGESIADVTVTVTGSNDTVNNNVLSLDGNGDYASAHFENFHPSNDGQTTVSFTMTWDGESMQTTSGQKWATLFSFENYDVSLAESGGDAKFGFNTAKGDVFGIANADEVLQGTHDVTVVFDNTSQRDMSHSSNKIFIDGQEMDLSYQRGHSSNVVHVDNDVRIGAFDYSNNHSVWDDASRYTGSIDNVKVFDTGLTPAEVATNSDNLIAHYDFEGDNPLADKSGNGNDAIVHGDAHVEGSESTLNDTFERGKDFFSSHEQNVEHESNRDGHRGKMHEHHDNGKHLGEDKGHEDRGHHGKGEDNQQTHENMQNSGHEDSMSQHINGGDGFDTLVASDNHMNIDLSLVENKVSNIESIDLHGGNNSLAEIKLEDVINVTDEENILRIDGDSSNHIALDIKGNDAEWKLGDFKTDNETGNSYQEYTATDDDGSSVTIEVDANIHVDES